MMKRGLGAILVGICVCTMLGQMGASAGDYDLPIMRLTSQDLQELANSIDNVPWAPISVSIADSIADSVGESFDLLDHFEYVAQDRNQGGCGNCWVWAGMGVMEIALDVEESITERLSVQQFTSCWVGGATNPCACCGGNSHTFAAWIKDLGYVIPWSNTDADWQDAGRTCNTCATEAVSCKDILVLPQFTVSECERQYISTHNVAQDQAIANIKNILQQDRAIYFSMQLPTEADWDQFGDFWHNDDEQEIWSNDYSEGHDWTDDGGGHAVLCVGYDDTDENNSYWIMVNSWGAPADRANGIFRVNMDLNYSLQYPRPEGSVYGTYWYTIDVEYDVSSIDRGLAWLRDQQLENGSWDNGTGATAMALQAFLNAGYEEGNAIIDDAVEYLLLRFNSGDGSFGDNKTYETSLAILALATTQNPDYDDEIAAAKDFLLDDCWDEGEGYDDTSWYYGGYGYGSDNRPDLSNTQFAVVALRVAGVPDDHDIFDKIELFTTRCQNRPASNDQTFAHNAGLISYDDGGFIYLPGQSIVGNCVSTGTMTTAGIWTLRSCSVPPGDARILAALQWIRNNEDCSFDANPNGGTNYLSYYLWSVAKALLMCNEDELNCGAWYPNLVDSLAASQSENGSWTLSNLGTLNDTCFSILALQSSQPIPANHWIQVILASYADLHIYDPQGRHLGMNYDTGLIENEIPGASFTEDAAGRQIITLPELEAGHYRIELIGTGDGGYELTVDGYRDLDIISTKTVAGQITLEELHVVDVIVGSLIGALTIFVEDPMVAPTGLQASAGYESVTLSWLPYDAPDFDLAGHHVYRSETPGSGYVQVNVAPIEGTTYMDMGLQNETTYYYVIAAVDSIGSVSPRSHEASATPREGPVGTIACFDFEYADQAAMTTAGWQFSGLWNLVEEGDLDHAGHHALQWFPSEEKAVYFGDVRTGTYGGASTAPASLTPTQRAAGVQPQSENRPYGELTSPEIPVDGLTGVELGFWYFRDVECYDQGTYDKTYIQAAFDGGSWQTVWSLDSQDCTIPNEWVDPEIFAPDGVFPNGGLPTASVAVPSGAASMRVRFVFDAVDNYANNFTGWVIDELCIRAAGSGELRIEPQSLPEGLVEHRYSSTLQAIGGTPEYGWRVIEKPSWLAVTPRGATCTLMGTPTEAGSYQLCVGVGDSRGQSAQICYELRVEDALPGGVVFFDDFEGGQSAAWSAEDLWHLSDNVACVSPAYGSATHAYYYGRDATCNYATSGPNQGTLQSPNIDISGLPAGTPLTVGWRQYRDVELFDEGNYDATLAEVSLDGGTSWHQIWYADCADMCSSDWEAMEIATDLTGASLVVPANASDLYIRYTFNSVDVFGNDYVGWLIDDVWVGQQQAGTLDLTISTGCEALGTPHAGDPYSTQLGVQGGTPPYTWSMSCSIPGLSLDPSTGLLAGTPAQAGQFCCDFTVQDVIGAQATLHCCLTIMPDESACVLLAEYFANPQGWLKSGLWTFDGYNDCLDCNVIFEDFAYYGIPGECDFDTGLRTMGALTSPVVDLSDGTDGLVIEFDSFRHVEDGKSTVDRTYLEIRFNGGAWQTIWEKSAADLSPECEYVQLGKLLPESAVTFQLRFMFDSWDGLFNQFAGWAVDNLQVFASACKPEVNLQSLSPMSLEDTDDVGLEVLNVPNPVRDVNTTRFYVRSAEVEIMRIQIYDLDQNLVYEEEIDGNELIWHTTDRYGEYLANGVYFYRALVKIGAEWITTSIQKLIILR